MTDDRPPMDHKVIRPFVWIPASTHDNGSDEFRKRQQARIKAANDRRAALASEVETKVSTMKRREK